MAKRALEVAAAGQHNLLMVGPPGVGKTFIAERLPGLLPGLTLAQSLDLAKLYSFTAQQSFEDEIPFRRPHHKTSYAGLLGGGSPFQPGEVSLAHHGVLFLDELCEFGRDVLEALREPLELHAVRVSRAESHFELPAQFMLIAASNLCPCGASGDGAKTCECTDRDMRSYQQKMSAAIRDRIDLSVALTRPCWADLETKKDERIESSAQVKERVIAARIRQAKRFGIEAMTNAHVERKHLMEHIKLSDAAKVTLQDIQSGQQPSVRSYDKLLRVAQTLADLAEAECVDRIHVLEALGMRKFVAGP